MQKSIKSLLLFLILGIVSSMSAMNSENKLNLADFDIKKTKDLTKSTILKFYKNNKEIAYSEYSCSLCQENTNASVDILEIGDREDRGDGLGKRIALYIASDIPKEHTNIKTLVWTSAARDKDYMSQEGLDKFYKNLGGIYNDTIRKFTFNIEQLKNTLFDQEKTKDLKFSDITVKKSSNIYGLIGYKVYSKNNEEVARIDLAYFEDYDVTLSINIRDVKNQKKGLGKQLLLYAFNKIINDYPSIKEIDFRCDDKNLQPILKRYGAECNKYGQGSIDIKDVPEIMEKLKNETVKNEIVEEPVLRSKL